MAAPGGPPAGSLWTLADRYGGHFELPPVSYGTARDFADSVDHIGGTLTANGDMKDLQRCWMVKAVLGTVERGARILEIGAGEPLVASVLSRLGYRVTIVDPYDGSGNGPREFEDFRSFYPDLEFVRARFPPKNGLNPGFSAIYSVSVLEHVPLEETEVVLGGTSDLLDPEVGCSIHAVDHVLSGWGAEAHLERLERLLEGLRIPMPLLAEAIARLERDPETYLVSAEAHNRWRGDLPYDDYAMRRIASMQLFSGP